MLGGGVKAKQGLAGILHGFTGHIWGGSPGDLHWAHIGHWGRGGAIPEPAQGGRWQFHTGGHSTNTLSV